MFMHGIHLLLMMGSRPGLRRLPHDGCHHDVNGIRSKPISESMHTRTSYKDESVDGDSRGVTSTEMQVIELQDYEPTPLATRASAISKALLNFALSSSVACTLLYPPHPCWPELRHTKSSLPHMILVLNP